MQPSPYKKGKKRICDPTGWWWSEKLDGMKGRWIDGKLITRSGLAINAPKWFINLLPKGIDIEGELYFGKNTFHKTASLRSSSTSRTSSNSWKKIEFYVFDIIDYELTWFERQQKLFTINFESPIFLVKWKKVKSIKSLEKRFSTVIEQGGEGVVIANPSGKYVNGHVDHMLKYKKIIDCEAIVIGYKTNSDGDRLASLIVNPLVGKNPRKKITFNIGTGLKIAQRRNYQKYFPIGTVVKYSYELIGVNGKPRSPVYMGIRNDI